MYANDHINSVYEVGKKSYLWRKLLSLALRRTAKGLKHKLQILLVKLTAHVFFQKERFVNCISLTCTSAPGHPRLPVWLCSRSLWHPQGGKGWWSLGSTTPAIHPFLQLLDQSFCQNCWALSCTRPPDGSGFAWRKKKEGNRTAKKWL